METVPLEILRVAFAQSAIATLATQVNCYLKLATHPDVLVVDLLDALSRNSVIGDDAAARLQRRFAADDPSIRPIAQRAYWEEVLQNLGVDPYSPFYPPMPRTTSTPTTPRT